MDFQEIKLYAEDCFRDTPPPCACKCPFNLNIRDLVNKVKRGKYGSAYRSYRDAVIFPEIVSSLCSATCSEACVRDGHDTSVDLKLIEEGIVKLSDKRPPVKYAISKKNEKIAIIGSGLSGLACTFRLASKGYDVTVFEMSGQVGNNIREKLSEGVFEKEYDNIFNQIEFKLQLNTLIENVESLLDEYDAVYVATGKNGNDFKLLMKHDALLLSTAIPGVFLGGSISGADVAWSIENGIRAASAIEEYIKIGRIEGMSPVFSKPAINENYYKLNYDFASISDCKEGNCESDSENYNGYVAEAERCLECNCSICIDKCMLMQHYNTNPKRIAADLGLTVLPIDEKIKRIGSRMLNSCSLCNLCTAVCPAGIDTCEAMYSSREIMSNSEHIPPAYHDFWMEDMEFSMSEEAFYVVKPKSETSEFVFFPGCQLTASSPELVEKTYEYIKSLSPSASMILSCCGIPAEWAAETEVFEGIMRRLEKELKSMGFPKMLFACSSCMKTFNNRHPEIEGKLIYEWLLESDIEINHDCITEATKPIKACVYDPCSSRYDSVGQNAVRKLAEKYGYELEEIDSGKHEAACCGFGGHIYSANPELYGKIVNERISDSKNSYITYCANCRDAFILAGKESRHILEVLFAEDITPFYSNKEMH